MANLKIKNSDGTTGEIEIPEGATVDFKGMGVLNSEEVTALKQQAVSEGFDKGKKSLEELFAESKTKQEKAEADLTSYKATLNDKEKNHVQTEERLQKLMDSQKSLLEKMEATEQKNAQSEFANMIGGATSSVAFVGSGRDIFQNFAGSKRINGGQKFALSDGMEGDASKLFQEWSGSETGKALIKSSENGGTGKGAGDALNPTDGKITSMQEYMKFEKENKPANALSLN